MLSQTVRGHRPLLQLKPTVMVSQVCDCPGLGGQQNREADKTFGLGYHPGASRHPSCSRRGAWNFKLAKGCALDIAAALIGQNSR